MAREKKPVHRVPGWRSGYRIDAGIRNYYWIVSDCYCLAERVRIKRRTGRNFIRRTDFCENVKLFL